jgi:hypothetical protein
MATDATSQTRPHRYFAAAWTVAAVLVFLGFARTYFLRAFFTSKALPLVLHLHGAFMTAWLALFIVQVKLIAAHRVRLHRRLGVLGAVLASLIVIVGSIASVRAQRLGHRPPGTPMVEGLYEGLIAFWVFGGLVGAALLLRRRGDYHQRLMLLATLDIVQAAVGRLPRLIPWINLARGPFGLFSLDLLLIYACVAWDTLRRHRLHPAFGFGLPAFVALENLLVTPLAGTAAWLRFATSVVS